MEFVDGIVKRIFVLIDNVLQQIQVRIQINCVIHILKDV